MTKLIVPQWPVPEGVAACSSTRIGGVSLPPYDSLNLGAHCGDNLQHVEENRRRMFAAGGLPSYPVWLEQVHGTAVLTLDGGSITHTTKHAHAAVMAKQWCSGIGIDSEHVVESGADIVAMCCTPFERATWFGDAIDPLRATLLFSAKESFYKAVYPVVRRFVDFDEVEVVAWHDHCASLCLRPRESGDLKWVPDSTCVRFSLKGASPVTVHTAVLLPPISIKGYQ